MKNIARDEAYKIILSEITDERTRQDKRWGIQNHDPGSWILILLEEVGEAAKELLEYKFVFQPGTSLTNYRKEMIQVAAVAIATIESFDRNEGRK